MQDQLELFNDFEQPLCNENRAKIMYNIFRHNSNSKGFLSGMGRDSMVKYFDAVPSEDRADVFIRLTDLIKLENLDKLEGFIEAAKA